MYDYHTHTNFSADGHDSPERMLRAAISKGLREYAVTDHYDPDHPNDPTDYGDMLPRYRETLNRLEAAHRSEIRLVKGLEIGVQQGETMKKCEAAAAAGYDFILASVHVVNGLDICFADELFREARDAEEGYRMFYGSMAESLRRFKDYDVIAHFNIIDRYARRIPAWDAYRDVARMILETAVADGKGLEINTSSFRYGMGERTTPTLEILRLYAELGGEIVTVGSDAHRAEDVGHMYERAVEMARAAGFRHIATFRERRPAFVKI